MTSLLASLGAVFGIAFAFLHQKFDPSNGLPPPVSPEDVDALISEGESEHMEFKSSLRWDLSEGRVNRELEAVVAKTLCGLMNHRGGLLLIGVDDDGRALGIRKDCGTLLYLAHCPMAFDNKGGMWMQSGKTVANPYYGAMMLRCGSVQKQITGKSGDDH